MTTSRDLLVQASSEPLVTALERAARHGGSFLVHGGAETLHRPAWEVIADATGRKTSVLAVDDYDGDQGSWLGPTAARAVGSGAEVLVLGHLYTPEAVLVAERMSTFANVVASCLVQDFAGATQRLGQALSYDDRAGLAPALGFRYGLGLGPLGSSRVLSWDTHAVRSSRSPWLEEGDVTALWRSAGRGGREPGQGARGPAPGLLEPPHCP